MTTRDARILAYDQMADCFDAVMNRYDLERRLSVLIDDFLGGYDLTGSMVLDAGSGTGWGSWRLKQRGAKVVSLDIGANLVRLATARGGAMGIVADIVRIPFPADTFDVVFSTEVIEHTTHPLGAVSELYRVLKPQGHLALSTPNRGWLWAVRLANWLHLRPYEGFENFLWPWELSTHVRAIGGRVARHRGVHLFPFQVRPLQSALRRLDRFGERLLPLMINQCLLIEKPVSDFRSQRATPL